MSPVGPVGSGDLSGGHRPLATPSLRRRVTVVVLSLVAVMLVVLGVVTDRVLADRDESQRAAYEARVRPPSS